MVKARGRILVGVIVLLACGIGAVFSAKAWADGYPRGIVIAQALDAQEAWPYVPVAGQPDVKAAYIAEKEKYYFAVPVDKKHSFEAGYEAYSYIYAENVNHEKFMNLKGSYTGYFINYAYRPVLESKEEYIPDEYRVEGRFASGNVDYTGSGSYDGIHDSMFEIRGLAGRRFSLWNHIESAPYMGLGYRNLLNRSSVMPAHDGYPSGYDRESRYIYLPFGSDFRTNLRGGWGLDMNLEYDRLIWGQQQTHLEDMKDINGNNAGYDRVINRQKSGYGIRGSVKLVKDVNQRVNIFVEPFYRYWNIGASDWQAATWHGQAACDKTGCWGSIEPNNTTQEIGLKMGLGF